MGSRPPWKRIAPSETWAGPGCRAGRPWHRSAMRSVSDCQRRVVRGTGQAARARARQTVGPYADGHRHRPGSERSIVVEQIRQARATWNGNLAAGRGTVRSGTSGAFPEMPTTWAARFEEAQGRTSPEELLAAAHASCFSMAFSGDLSKAGFPPEHVDVTATVTIRKLDRWT